MIRSICLVSVFCIFTSNISITAQDQQDIIASEFRRQALVIDISTSVLTEEEVVIWNEFQRRLAIPGSPVGIRLVGSNVIVAVQFTPFIRREGNVLIAQGQIWIVNPGHDVSYYTSIQVIPIDFNEDIYYFPLGTSNSSIEILLSVYPYSEIAALEEANANAGNDN